MSLRLQINLIIAALMIVFIGALGYQQIEDTRSSVREEIEASNRVATQLLTRVSWVYQEAGLRGMLSFLGQLGRVRANEVLLYDPDGQVVYASPASPYKSGRDAPHWYARLVSPAVEPQEIRIGGGRLVLRADSSRAVLDGWDSLTQLLLVSAIALAVINPVVFWATGRVLQPLQILTQGLQRIEQGDYAARLPTLKSKEGRLLSLTFNRTAQAVAESITAQKAASEARQRLQENRELTQMIRDHIEEERRTIARELHDELGQSITAIKSMGLSIVQRTEGDAQRVTETAGLIVETAGRMYDAVHEMIPRLRPFALDAFGLADALGDLVAEWRTRHPELDLRLTVDEPLPALGDALTTCAYRVVQESLNNALRHAVAKRIEVSVHAVGSELVVRVADDGVGLPPQWEQPRHYGVRGMRERAAALGGTFELLPGDHGGAQAVARLPLASPS